MDAIAIRPLTMYAQQIPLIAGWFYKEWRALYGEQTETDVRQRLESWLTQGTIPTAFAAVLHEQVIGTVALKEFELQFPEAPWLAGLFVVPELRGHGAGKLLVQAAEREALILGVQRLFLYTPDMHEFYLRLGWRMVEWRLSPVGRVAVMSKVL